MRNDGHRQEALGQSESFLELQENIAKVAPVERPVLLIGERGTGKELAASRLHFLSKRWQGPMVTLNCSSLSPNLIEAELFGHVKGAFTGAEESRKGRFEMADNGTLFLDELGTIPLEVQEKILRVVEYGVFERVGGTKQIDVDVRIIGATNADLRGMVKEGRFKPDLLDRLSFEVITLPPLRFRGEDIMLLANHFAGRISFELGRDIIPEFSTEVTEKMLSYRWEGNIRELKNVVERAVYKSSSEMVDEIVFDPFDSPYILRQSSVVEEKERPIRHDSETERGIALGVPMRKAVRELEVSMINSALQVARYNQREAARLLNLTYDQLRGKLKKYKEEISL